jgi:hypothetical protein
MKSNKPSSAKSRSVNSVNPSRDDIAVKTASVITDAIARSKKFGAADGKINIHVHVGDVILIGFDEAIDAEEWGMRENNTEVIGGKARKGRPSTSTDTEGEANKDKKVSRSIQFRKGALELSAIENSEPSKPVSRRKTPTKKTAAKKRLSK